MKINNKKGFTLVEMIIVVTIFSILIAAAYSLFNHLLQTYQRAERKWIIEREISETMELLVDAMDVSLSASLATDETNMLTNTDTIVIYYNETDKTIMVREAGDEATPYALNDGENFPVELSFTNIKKTDNGGGTFTEEERDKVIFITLKSLDPEIDYTLETGVYLQNMKNDKIKIPEIRTGVYEQPPYYAVSFKTAQVNTGMGGATKMNFTGCFIATAAYGDYDDNMVMLLRRFRDQCLLTNPVGEKFVEFYYNVSPPIADFIADSNLLKNIVKILLLPLVGIALFLLHPAPISAIIMVLIGLVILVKYLAKKRKKLADI